MSPTPKTVPYRNAAQFGREVRAARHRTGLTQVELAQRAGVGSKFLYELEHGKDTLRMDKVFDVLEVLSIQKIIFPYSTRRQPSYPVYALPPAIGNTEAQSSVLKESDCVWNQLQNMSWDVLSSEQYPCPCGTGTFSIIVEMDEQNRTRGAWKMNCPKCQKNYRPSETKAYRHAMPAPQRKWVKKRNVGKTQNARQILPSLYE